MVGLAETIETNKMNKALVFAVLPKVLMKTDSCCYFGR